MSLLVWRQTVVGALNRSALSGEIVVLLIWVSHLQECMLGGRAEGLDKHRPILPWINLAAFSKL